MHPIQSDDDARALAKTIVKTVNGMSVKFGRTNGHPVLHLIDRKAKRSATIRSKSDWTYHIMNPYAHKE